MSAIRYKQLARLLGMGDNFDETALLGRLRRASDAMDNVGDISIGARAAALEDLSKILPAMDIDGVGNLADLRRLRTADPTAFRRAIDTIRNGGRTSDRLDESSYIGRLGRATDSADNLENAGRVGKAGRAGNHANDLSNANNRWVSLQRGLFLGTTSGAVALAIDGSAGGPVTSTLGRVAASETPIISHGAEIMIDVIQVPYTAWKWLHDAPTNALANSTIAYLDERDVLDEDNETHTSIVRASAHMAFGNIPGVIEHVGGTGLNIDDIQAAYAEAHMQAPNDKEAQMRIMFSSLSETARERAAENDNGLLGDAYRAVTDRDEENTPDNEAAADDDPTFTDRARELAGQGREQLVNTAGHAIEGGEWFTAISDGSWRSQSGASLRNTFNNLTNVTGADNDYSFFSNLFLLIGGTSSLSDKSLTEQFNAYADLAQFMADHPIITAIVGFVAQLFGAELPDVDDIRRAAIGAASHNEQLMDTMRNQFEVAVVSDDTGQNHQDDHEEAQDEEHDGITDPAFAGQPQQAPMRQPS